MKKSRFVALIALILSVVFMLTACGNPATDTPVAENTAETKVAETTTTTKNSEVVRISIDEWIGYQNLLDANGGLTTAPDSLNAKHGINVEYVVINNPNDSSNALISGELAGAGYTVNRYAFLQSKFNEANLDVVMPFITNFSNGGDGIIAKSDILSINDLVGKKVAVPKFSEAQTLVEWLINNSSLTEGERAEIRNNMVYFETAEDTGKAFFSGSVDAAATWEPYLTMAASSTDSRILFDTSMSTNLILSGIVFREDFLEENEEFMINLIDAAFEASSMYKKEFSNIRQMPMFELMTDQEIIDMANGADLTTWSQNCKLLTEDAVLMYEDMANVWITVGEQGYPDMAKTAFTDKYVQKLKSKYEGKDESTASSTFDSTNKAQIIESPDALLSYNADIKFALNSFEISQESYAELDEFVKVAKILDGVYIQIEGNASRRADGVTEAQIIEFSTQRAQSIANYFTQQGIAEERMIVVGNGDSNPLNKENTAAAENRRTEIYFKTKMGY